MRHRGVCVAHVPYVAYEAYVAYVAGVRGGGHPPKQILGFTETAPLNEA